MKKLFPNFIFPKRVLRTVLLVLCGAVLGVNVYFLNANQLIGDQIPMPFGVGVSVVLSGSMEPTLSVGDLLIIKEQSAYEKNDIVVYQSGNMAVVHRLVDTDGEMLVTRGDANNIDDAPIEKEAVKGSVTAAIPLIGYIVIFLKTPVGIAGTLAAAVWLVEGSFRREKAAQDAEQEKIKAEIQALLEELREE